MGAYRVGIKVKIKIIQYVHVCYITETLYTHVRIYDAWDHSWREPLCPFMHMLISMVPCLWHIGIILSYA